jgi:phospholipid/cholesterol/gamma-HCH transport system substrate-binding protein
VNDEYKVPKGSKATVKAIGIFGDVAIALTPPTPAPAQDYAPGDTVPPGAPSADVDVIMSRVDSMAQTTAVLLKAIRSQVVEAGTLNEIHRTMANAATLSLQLQRVIAQQNTNATETMASFRDAAGHLSHMVDSADFQATMANMRQTSANAARLSANLDSTNTQLRSLMAKAENGNGTLGKLLSDTTLYRDIRHSVQSLDSLLTDFKANPKKYINLRIF